MNKLSIYFDLDGTLFDLYGVDGWLKMIRAENAKPYEIAKPMVDFEKLAALLIELKKKGVHLGIITWLAKGSSREYDKKVRKAKREALKQIGVDFDEIHMVKYGRSKREVAQNKANRVLFDDNVEVLEDWQKGRYESRGIKVHEQDILTELKKLLDTV